jgi:uncharacterized protein
MNFTRIKRQLKRSYFQLFMQKTSASSVAFSFALGTFIAILPTPGFGVFIGLFLAYIFKNLNNLSILASFAFWNPILLAPVYLLSYKVGDWIFEPSSLLQGEMIAKSIFYVKTYLLGNFILGMLISAICYIIVYKALDNYKNRKAQKRVNRRLINTYNDSIKASA